MWPETITVITPTVARRAAPWTATLAQWRATGVEPHVRIQDPDWPLGHESQRVTSDLLVTDALQAHPSATHFMFAEDDIDLSPDLPDQIGTLVDDRVVTLFVSGTRHYPASVRQRLHDGLPLDRQTTPVADFRAWWGSQAVLLPRVVLEAVHDWRSPRCSWDDHLKGWLEHTGTGLYVAVPNLVQHRGVPPMVNPRGGMYRSTTYGWPTS